jgi:hypothetical protein
MLFIKGVLLNGSIGHFSLLQRVAAFNTVFVRNVNSYFNCLPDLIIEHILSVKLHGRLLVNSHILFIKGVLLRSTGK